MIGQLACHRLVTLCGVCVLQELDVLAAQLNHLASGGSRPMPNPPEEDEDSDEDTVPAGHDGTMLASEPPRPL